MITLATLEQATAQEVFDQVAAHMLTQKQRSMINHDVCAYRGDGGLKCAAGCLMSDEEAKFVSSQGMNTTPWSTLISQGVVLSNKHSRLISELQGIHDNSQYYPEEDWIVRLKNIAELRNLNSTIIDQFENK
jgi:hypothetical protein